MVRARLQHSFNFPTCFVCLCRWLCHGEACPAWSLTAGPRATMVPSCGWDLESRWSPQLICPSLHSRDEGMRCFDATVDIPPQKRLAALQNTFFLVVDQWMRSRTCITSREPVNRVRCCLRIGHEPMLITLARASTGRVQQLWVSWKQCSLGNGECNHLPRRNICTCLYMQKAACN